MQPRNANLTLVNDRHSKAYNLQLIQVEGGWVVNFQYGAIGRALTPGTKTNKGPVSYEDANRIYEKLIREKTMTRCDCCGGVYGATGATEVVSAPVAQRASEPATAPPTSSFTPELLEPVDVAPTSTEPDRYTLSDAYGAQRKYDGVRLAIDYTSKDRFQGYNRKGEPVTIPENVLARLREIDLPMRLDGEFIAATGQYVVFDLLRFFRDDVSVRPYSERHNVLSSALGSRTWEGTLTGPQRENGAIVVASLFLGRIEKTRLLERELQQNGEGVVYKKLSAAYMPGRRGVNVKRKFWKQATVRVCRKPKEDGKASFGVEVMRDGKWYWIGTVTLTKTAELPALGSYREVKYLYLGVGNRLYQPEDWGPRTDVDASDCTFDQLKRKQSAELLAA